MSSFFVLNNVVAPALPLWGRSDGRPTKFLFWEDLTQAGAPSPEPKQGYTGANCCECPDDNGDSWTVADVYEAARGAFIFVEIVGKVNMAEVVNRLHACKANQKRIFDAAGNPAPEYVPGPIINPTPAPPADDRPMWQRVTRPDGSPFASKAEWVAAGRPHL